MNEMMMALLMSGRGMDMSKFGNYLRQQRAQREKDFAKVARGIMYGAYWLTGALKLQVTNASGQTVPATDASVSTTAKLDALLSGEAEIWRAIPYFGFMNEAATFIGEVIARATTMDPTMLELLMANNAAAAPAQTVTLQSAPAARGGYAQPVPAPQTLRITSPQGASTPIRITAQGISIENPDWQVSVDERR
jgi:hypothetical protein